MSRLDFLSPDACESGVALGRPLRARSPTRPSPTSRELGKLEVRGDRRHARDRRPGEQLLPLGPERALLVVDGPPAAARRRLATAGLRVYDMSAGLAALEVEGDDLLRRLTELDLDQLPATGSIARGTPALIERRDGDRFRLYVPQELGHYVAEVVADLARGLGR